MVAEQGAPLADGACPRCDHTLDAPEGALAERVCSSCEGRFLPPEGTARLVAELGLDTEFLRQLVADDGGPPLSCPGCGTTMSALELQGEAVELCLGCGGLWLDAGELEAVSPSLAEELASDAAARKEQAERLASALRNMRRERPAARPRRRTLPRPWGLREGTGFIVGVVMVAFATFLFFVGSVQQQKDEIACEGAGDEARCRVERRSMWSAERREVPAADVNARVASQPDSQLTVVLFVVDSTLQLDFLPKEGDGTADVKAFEAFQRGETERFRRVARSSLGGLLPIFLFTTLVFLYGLWAIAYGWSSSRSRRAPH
jgi:Zn-finger nucleic acid-binding protein